MQSHFVFLGLLAFLCGVALRSIVPVGISFVWWCVLMAGALLALFIVVRSTAVRSALLVTVVMVSAFAAGAVRMHAAVPSAQYYLYDTHVGASLEVTGTVVTDPQQRGTRQQFQIVTHDQERSTRMIVRTQRYAPEVVLYGDRVTVHGAFDVPRAFVTDSGRIFDYQGFLAKDHVPYIINNAVVTNVTPAEVFSLARYLFSIKHTYIEALQGLIPHPVSALAGGITVGEKQALGNDLEDAFRATGLIHIVVLSGYNISIIILFLMAALSWLPRPWAAACGAVAAVLFAMLVGGGATVVRATIMGVLAAAAIILKRTYAIGRALVIAGVAMVVWNPYVLVYDPSFQLSFIATLGLVYMSPIVERYIPWVTEKLYIRDIVAATVATQIAVLPLLVYMIGEVSVVGLIVNVLVLPMMSVAMSAVFLSGGIGMVSAMIAVPFSWAAYLSLQYIVRIVEWFALLPFAVVVVPAIPFALLVGVYGALAIVTHRALKRIDQPARAN